ncbi:DeoR family glycerol-3-phosphate regulon repressor [Bradyrhizobium sp. USDA 4473]
MAGLSHRQTEILNIARAFGRVMVEDLAKRFEVSAQTIRKDLNDLCDERSLTRIHGGAIIASGVENLAYEARRFVAAEEKKAIGAAAAARIPNGCSLFINIGTTTEEVASALTSHEDLLVITNNLNVAMLLYRHPRIEVVVAGGTVRRADGAVVGSTATQLIGQFKVDYAIIGASAIDEEGALLDFDYREVQVAQAIIANARNGHAGVGCDQAPPQRAGAHRAYEPDPDLRHRFAAPRRPRQHLSQPRYRGGRRDGQAGRRYRRQRNRGRACDIA